jgi:hypothetical protein
MELSTHFSFEELNHTDTGLPNECPDSLSANALTQAELLEECRVLVGPLHINSWFRNTEVNDAVGGEHDSYHLLALATDVVPNGDITNAFKMLVASGIQYDKIILEKRKSYWLHIQSPKPGEKPRHQAFTSHVGANSRMEYEPFTV